MRTFHFIPVALLTGLAAGCASLESSRFERDLSSPAQRVVPTPIQIGKPQANRSNLRETPQSVNDKTLDLTLGSQATYADLAYILSKEGYPLSIEDSALKNRRLGNFQHKGRFEELISKMESENALISNWSDSTVTLKNTVDLVLSFEEKGVTDRYFSALMRHQGFAADNTVPGLVRIRCDYACYQKAKDITEQFNETPIALPVSIVKLNLITPAQSDIGVAERLNLENGTRWSNQTEVFQTTQIEKTLLDKLDANGVSQVLGRTRLSLIPGARISSKDLGLELFASKMENQYTLGIKTTTQIQGELELKPNHRVVVVTGNKKNSTLFILSPSVKNLGPMLLKSK